MPPATTITASTIPAPPNSIHRSDSRNNSKLLLQKDKLIESLRLELAEAQIKLSLKDAVRTAETCRDMGWNAPADAYDAACYLSLCIPIVAKHDKLDDKQRKEAAQFYGDAAMKILRDAVSKGFKNVAHMKQDTDLDPLRQREDFKKLIAELEGKGK